VIHRAVLATFVVALATSATAGPISPGDRQRLVAHLEMTEAWLVSKVAGLSDAQLTFLESTATWTSRLPEGLTRTTISSRGRFPLDLLNVRSIIKAY